MTSVLIVVIIFVLLGCVAVVVSAPLRGARRPPDSPAPSEPQPGEHDQAGPSHEDLEAAREAKYREIRDAELDFRTGKLSRADYEALDGELRREALTILDRIEREGASEEPPPA